VTELAAGKFKSVETNVTSCVVSIDPFRVGGLILYSNSQPLENVQVDLTGSDFQTFYTNQTGHYLFQIDSPPNDATYTITPTKTDDPEGLNGIDVQDIASIRRHILQTELLSNPYQIIAADVNQSKSVSTLDLVLVQALILGINTSFPDDAQWTLVPSDFQFTNAQNPFPYPLNKTVTTSSPGNNNFVGIKYGDVNNSRDNTQSGRVQMADVIFETGYPLELGNEITFPVRVYGFKNISAYQFTMKWNTDELEYSGREDGNIAGSFGEQSAAKGIVTTLWDNTKGKSTNLEDGSTLFTLRFTKKTETAKITIEPAAKMQAMVFNSNLEKLNFVSQEGKEDLNNFEAGIYPNPFTNQVNIKLILPEAGKVALEIITIDGRKIKASVAEGNKGLNTFTWDGKSDAGNETKAGMFIMKIFYKNNVKVEKVVKY
jgi:hypothetical protein